jgi:uncharacterized membrane protein YhaH (DUF805 family)
MIYKFIDNNGAEITVNSLSSLEALIESATVKENTQVKAGLRGKWTAAINIDELRDLFNKKVEEIAEPEIPEEDIKSFTTKEEPVEQETIPEPVKQDIVVEKIEPIIRNEEISAKTFENDLRTDEELQNSEINRDKTYDDDNVIGINIFDAVGICFKKYFVLKGRASRSEYWYFYLFSLILYIIPFIIGGEDADVFIGLFILILTIPSVTVSIRRLHDIDKSGWYVFIYLIPFVGGIIMLVMCASVGTEGKNQFGEYPLQLKKKNNL